VPSIGKTLVVVGVVFVAIGAALMFSDRIPFLGKLPGDITIKRGNFRFSFPITTSIVLSVLISAALWLFSHFKGK